MNSRVRVTKTLRHEEVDRVPRNLWSLPAISMFRNEELDAILQKYPMDFDSPTFAYGTGKHCKECLAKSVSM